MYEVLFVDDEENVLSGYKRILRRKYDIKTASSGAEALEIIENRDVPFPVVVVDMQMPEMDGVTLLKEINKKCPDCVKLMLTGNADQKTAMEAINEGQIFRFLTKPCPVEALEKNLDASIKQYELIVSERVLLEKTLYGSVKVLFDVLSMVDPFAYQRATKIRKMSAEILKTTGVAKTWKIEMASMLSHLGVLSIPKEIVDKVWKKRPLSTIEQQIYSEIPEVNVNLLKNIPRLKPILRIMKYINNNFDGSNNPVDKIFSEKIPLESRIIRIVSDYIDLSESNPPSVAIYQMVKNNEGKYDPSLLTKIEKVLLKLEAKQEELKAVTIPIESLSAGDALASDIVGNNGKMLLRAGQIITPMHMKKIYYWRQTVGVAGTVDVKSQDVTLG